MKVGTQNTHDGKVDKFEGCYKPNECVPDSYDWNALNWAQPSWMKDRTCDSHSGRLYSSPLQFFRYSNISCFVCMEYWINFDIQMLQRFIVSITADCDAVRDEAFHWEHQFPFSRQCC
jgi:hypothetical protein